MQEPRSIVRADSEHHSTDVFWITLVRVGIDVHRRNGGPSAVSLSLALIIASSIAVLRLSPYILNACALIERDNPSSESLAPPETYAFRRRMNTPV